MTTQVFQTDCAVAPGSHLAEWIEDCRLSKASAAWVLDLEPQRLDDVISGAQPIDAALAARLETRTTIPQLSWLRLERTYLQELARLGLTRPVRAAQRPHHDSTQESAPEH